jgi:peptidoglycan-N-acetylglucosamine deacetylase
MLWPNGNRVAVIVSLLLETWSDGHSPSYFPRTSPLRAGTTDFAGISWSQFGGNEGIWRLIRILNEAGIKGTVFANGRSAELYPEAMAQVVRSGHDIAGHGYYQDQLLAYMTPDEQQATIAKTLDALQQASGQRPTGWVTPIYGWTEETRDVLVRAGIQWCSDSLDASMPRREKTPSGSILLIPWSDFVDNRALRASPRNYFDVYKETFDYLYACEPMALINIGIHSHFGGRPLMAAMFRRILRYLQGFPGVWFARHGEVARYLTEAGIDNPSFASRFFG